ncbi:MAG: LOG family protein [Rubricoccaceae bacterium]
MTEIDTLDAFLVWANQEPWDTPSAVQGLDLSEQTELIQSKPFPGSLFLGCTLEMDAAGHIVDAGGIVIPAFKGLPFDVHRSTLYTVDELFDGFDLNRTYADTYDASVYRQYVEQGKTARRIDVSLARRLHDHSITDALEEIIHGQRVVAIMGGHGMERRDSFYREVALLSRTLTQKGFLMVSGGGPGAMEATHLGAYFATREPSDLDEAIAMLSPRPSDGKPKQEYNDPDWLHRAWRVRQAFPIPPGDDEACRSVGVPTWLYGHEPPAPFATHIAKYFANSVREDGLLAIAKHGVIFAPGSAGTTQEIFQDAAQNHYINEYGGHRVASPMILFGEKHWTEERPVWPLLSAVAKGKMYGELLALTDRRDEIVRRIQMYDPALYSAE